ncbi:MAG: CorA family divalent cation transporter [bacterium]|nr:CorA family divalent cation transporter [bacterium]
MSEEYFTPILTDSQHMNEVLKEHGIEFEGTFDLSMIGFCKIESQQECLAGTFCIPKLDHVLSAPFHIAFFINKDQIVLVDDSSFSTRLIERMEKNKKEQFETKEKFFYHYIVEFLSHDPEYLIKTEKSLMEIEEKIQQNHTENLHPELMKIRRELLVLREYYDEITDVGKALEEDENGYFNRKHLKYFGTVSDRAGRLMNKTLHLLEYAQQVRDAYQAAVDAKQNNNMQFLTLISTIFFPLTLITGWYGMNFRNMPELKNGYPGVIALSLVVIGVCVIVFKIKKIL